MRSERRVPAGPGRALLLFLATFAVLPRPGSSQERACPAPDAHHRYIAVPVDYGQPDGPTFRLYYEVSAGFDPSRPTVMLIGDAQGTPSALGVPDRESQRISPDLNYVAIGHRGMECSKVGGRFAGPAIDWADAWRVLNTGNVVEDIDRVRRDLLGDEGTIMALGGSGNGILTFQYLAKYGRHVTRAFIYNATPSIVRLNRDDGDNLTRVLAVHGVSGTRFRRLLETQPVPRRQLIWLLGKVLAATQPGTGEVDSLVSQLERGDRARFDAYTKQYLDVAVIFPLLAAEPAIAVRFFEVFGYGDGYALPDHVTSYLFADVTRPLRELEQAGAIAPRKIDLLPQLSGVDTEVFLLAGRWDATIPFIEMVSAAERMPHARLVVLNAGHLLADNRDCAFGMMKRFLTAASVDELPASAGCDVWTTIGFGR